LLLLLFYPVAIVVPADLSQQAKSATADGQTYSDSIDKKSAENLNLYTFCRLEKKLTDSNTFRRGLVFPYTTTVKTSFFNAIIIANWRANFFGQIARFTRVSESDK
jgi:hypothetical protein